MAKKRKFTRRLPKIRGRRSQESKKAGSAPGTLYHIGEKRVDEVSITIHDYSEEHIDSIEITEIEECKPYLENPSKTWISVKGLHDIEKLQSIWSYFNLHPLVQEDILNTSQRPKVEEYEDNIFFVLRMMHYTKEEPVILESEQISIVLGENYVLSFQESDMPHFTPVLERLKVVGTRLRRFGPDYLTYAIIDNIVDYYFGVLNELGDRLEETEEVLMDNPTQDTLHHIHTLRREAIFFRKGVWPLRDVINSVIRDDSQFIHDSIKVYLRDVYDHMVQIIDNIDNYRDMILGMHDMYMSQVSNKMNEVMKVLTIIATIFIPITFIAGVYGMNFDPGASPYNMPELSWYWGYPAAWASMIIVAAIMVYYFKRKEWL
ncbi:MAG: magnesium/cobalt transporter CorA [Balneolaceae bacterium]|nr:magnesium/cobalt transporter CorA [Balneolaceae bacterium]